MAKNKLKPSRRREVTLARPKTEKADVASPTVAGATEYVDRVIDLLTQMYNRRDISQIQFAAGDRYRTAFEMLSASAGGAGDFDRVRGSGEPGGMAIGYLKASKLVSDAKLRILYPRDYAVLHRVCVLGMTFEAVAADLSKGDHGVELDRKVVAFMFKSALSQLAAAWWPDKVPKIDQSTLDHLAEDRRDDDKPRFIEFGSADWDRVQNYRALQGLTPLVPITVKRGKVDVRGSWLRPENAPLTGMVAEKSVVTDAVVLEQSGKVAHATRDKVFYSNDGRRGGK